MDQNSYESSNLIARLEKIQAWAGKNILQIIILVCLLAYYDFFLFKEINLATADLGRHIVNGRIVLETGHVPGTNLFSYTHPDYPFINHHWGSGVVFYLIEKFSGFSGLSFFYIALSLLTFLIFFDLARRTSNFFLASALSFLVFPLMGERTEIRPEAFSFFFCGIFLWILWMVKRKKINRLWLYLLPALTLLWINMHIYFFMGLFLMGAFSLEELATKRKMTDYLKTLTIAGVLSVLSSLINPFGIKTLLYPLHIFDNYGYRVLENQSVWFLESLGFLHNPNYTIFKITLCVFILSFIYLFWSDWKKTSPSLSLIGIFFAGIALMAIRNFSVFGLFFLPVAGYNIKAGSQKRFDINDSFSKMIFFALGIIFFIITFLLHRDQLTLDPSRQNIGLPDNMNRATDFWKANNLKGPIFNDYDLGNYLIYGLYPEEKVFVDNRPEAYPAEFMERELVPMQENDDVWKMEDEKYKFNAIFFYLRDATPWGQKFLVSRVRDPDWVPVYVDGYSIIFLKNNELNRSVIEEHRLPPEMFDVTAPN